MGGTYGEHEEGDWLSEGVITQTHSLSYSNPTQQQQQQASESNEQNVFRVERREKEREECE